MRYTNQDLYSIMSNESSSSLLFELLQNFKEQEVHYYGGAMLTFSGSCVSDGDTYLVYMGTKLVNDKPVYYFTIDQVTVELEYKTYIYLSNYIIKVSELNDLQNSLKSEKKSKGWISRIFGE